MELIKSLFNKIVIWLLDNDEIRAAITKHVNEKLAEILAKLKEKSNDEEQQNRPPENGTGSDGSDLHGSSEA